MTGTCASLVEVKRAGSRFHTAKTGVESWHSFSFGAHYDPANLGFGPLLAHNDETLAPGAGFDPHPHRDVELVTYVVSGALAYSDDAGRTSVASAGFVQVASAGRGIVHAERNAGATEPVRFIQMWVAPDVRGIEPSYQLAPVADGGQTGRLVPLASGQSAAAEAPVRLYAESATLSLVRLVPDQSVELPAGRFVHVFVVAGGVRSELGGDLTTADALRLTGCGPSRVTATRPTELLIWRI